MGAKKAPGKLRIIGGQWRGRKLPVADLEGLRPTTDRVRETLFNWLAADLVGRHCLDLFAGTGALGLEALSRGAASCHFVERQRLAAELITAALDTLDGADRGTVIQTDAMRFLKSESGSVVTPPFGLIFLDPPFAGDVLEPALKALEQSPRVADDALLYLEYAAGGPSRLLPGWEPYRSKRSGGVIYELYRRDRHGD